MNFLADFIKIEKQNIKFFFVLLITLSFFLDSSGNIGWRKISIGVIFVVMLFNLKNILENRQNISSRINILGFIFLTYASVIVILNDLDIFFAANWYAVILLMMLFNLFFICINIKCPKNLIYCICAVFSFVFYITFFAMFIFGDDLGKLISKFGVAGWFYVRENGYPQVYFQATSIFVFFTLYLYINEKYFLSLVAFGVLVLSLSRFGIVVVVLQVLLLSVISKENLSLLIIKIFKPLAMIVLAVFLLLYLNQFNLIHNEKVMNGLEIRLAHLYSVFDYLVLVDLKNFFFGMGAGSKFYTGGLYQHVDNIEISQLELLRKYGVLGYILFMFFLSSVLEFFYQHAKFEIVVAIFAFYIFSFSNPTLFSTPFFLLISLAIYGIYREKTIHNIISK